MQKQPPPEREPPVWVETRGVLERVALTPKGRVRDEGERVHLLRCLMIAAG